MRGTCTTQSDTGTVPTAQIFCARPSLSARRLTARLGRGFAKRAADNQRSTRYSAPAVYLTLQSKLKCARPSRYRSCSTTSRHCHRRRCFCDHTAHSGRCTCVALPRRTGTTGNLCCYRISFRNRTSRRHPSRIARAFCLWESCRGLATWCSSSSRGLCPSAAAVVGRGIRRPP